MNRTVRLEAPAKVNLRLVVIAREETGYHSLETIFCGLALADRLEIAESDTPGIHLEVEGDVDTGPIEQNLVMRAARCFYKTARVEPAITIRLTKTIPSAAGLGGGSSDAAATLRALNAFHGRPCNRGSLLRLGAELGSDVPFFLTRSPLALAWGRGERLLELQPLSPKPVLVAHPGVAVPTAQAFARFAELRGSRRAAPPAALRPGALRGWRSLARLATNDLEVVAAERIPGLFDTKAKMVDAGAFITLLAGSGGALFGVFSEPAQLEPIERTLRAEGFATWRTATLSRWPEPTFANE